MRSRTAVERCCHKGWCASASEIVRSVISWPVCLLDSLLPPQVVMLDEHEHDSLEKMCVAHELLQLSSVSRNVSERDCDWRESVASKTV